MPQISYIKYTDVLEARRYDAEYFKPEYLETEKVIKKKEWDFLGNQKKYTRSFGAYALCNEFEYKKQGIPFLRCKDIKDGLIDFSDVLYIDDNANNLLSKSEVFPKTVLFSMSGSVGNCAIANEELKFPINSNQDIAKITTKESLNPYFLTMFLNSKYGNSQIKRFPIGSIQQHIFLWQLDKFIIPILPQSFQLKVEEIVKSAHQKQTQSKQLYREAEELLLSELGLLNYQVKHALSFFATKKEIDQAKRYDSEYFQPKYAEIIKKIEDYEGGWDLVDKMVKWKKGVEVGTEAYTETGKDFVRVSDFSIYGISEANRKISDEAFEELKKNYQPKQGEILFTKDGTIGLSYVLKEDVQGVLSGAFLRLTLKEKYQDFEKECLALILNSILCKMQVEKLSGGALIAHLKPSDFETFKIPLIKPSIQKQTAEKIQESHRLRKESKELLEEAKRKVEEEIENSA